MGISKEDTEDILLAILLQTVLNEDDVDDEN